MRTHTRPDSPNSDLDAALRMISTLCAALLLLFTGCSKKNASDITGYWMGEISVNGITLTLGVDITKAADGKFGATFDSLDQGARDIPVPELTYTEGNLHLGLKALAASYDGKVDASGKRIDGKWTQLNMSTPLILARASKPPIPDMTATDKDFEPRAGSDIQGLWKGTLSVGPTQLRIVFKIAESTEGKFSGMLDSVDQGARNIVLSSVSYVKPTIDIEVKQINGNFNGKLEADGKSIFGDWEQGGRLMPLTLTRANAGEFSAASNSAAYEWKSETEPQGFWSGALNVQGTTLRLTMKVARAADGKLSGTMDSLDQGARDLPMNSVVFENGAINMEWKALNATFEGEMTGDKLVGNWRQRGVGFPLTLERKKGAAAR